GEDPRQPGVKKLLEHKTFGGIDLWDGEPIDKVETPDQVEARIADERDQKATSDARKAAAKKSSAATAYELSKAREAAIEQFGKDGKAIPLDDQIKALKAAAPGRLIIVQFKGYAVAQADDGVAIAKATGKKMNEKDGVPPWVEIVDAELASVVATLHKLGHK